VSPIVYLHGFASGPGSKKARFFRERFAELGIGLEVPQLDEGDFQRLSLSGQLGVIERVSGGRPVTLLGSSMGGYLAALYAARHAEVEKLVLMAPAFCFLKRWTETLGPAQLERWRSAGSLEVFHYSQGGPAALGYQLIQDAARYEDYPDVSQPVLIFHGQNDASVPPGYSETFAAKHPRVRLLLLNSDHELLNVLDDMWMETEAFLLRG